MASKALIKNIRRLIWRKNKLTGQIEKVWYLGPRSGQPKGWRWDYTEPERKGN